RAVAAAAAPEPRRKSRRDSEGLSPRPGALSISLSPPLWRRPRPSPVRDGGRGHGESDSKGGQGPGQEAGLQVVGPALSRRAPLVQGPAARYSLSFLVARRPADRPARPPPL